MDNDKGSSLCSRVVEGVVACEVVNCCLLSIRPTMIETDDDTLCIAARHLKIIE